MTTESTMLRRFVSTSRCRYVLLMFCLMMGFSMTAAAQGRDDGSLYSRFGLGELRTFASSQAQAMGGGGAALWSFNYTNFGNPASWSHQVLVRAAAGLRFDGVQTTDANDNSKNLTAGSLNAVQFGVPLQANKLGIGITFEPFSRINYRVQTRDELIIDPTRQDSTIYQINYEGSGGLQQVSAGAGYRVTEGLSVGGSFNLIFGIVEEARRTAFSAPGFTTTNLATSTRMFGITGTFGATYTKNNILGEGDHLSFAASLMLPAKLNGDRALTLGESLNRDTLGTQVEGNIDIPLSARFGAAYYLQNRWTFIVDARYEPWSQFESQLSLPGYTPGDAARFRDRLRFSGGFEFLPAGTNLLDSYLKRVAYRLGFYYDQSYITPLAGSDINSMALTGGLSLPALLAGTRLDVNFEVGTRGTTDQGLVRDRFFGVSATLNVGERWFVKRKLR